MKGNWKLRRVEIILKFHSWVDEEGEVEFIVIGLSVWLLLPAKSCSLEAWAYQHIMTTKSPLGKNVLNVINFKIVLISSTYISFSNGQVKCIMYQNYNLFLKDFFKNNSLQAYFYFNNSNALTTGWRLSISHSELTDIYTDICIKLLKHMNIYRI